MGQCLTWSDLWQGQRVLSDPRYLVSGEGRGCWAFGSSNDAKRHRFPAAVIQHAVWLNFHFTLSLRDVEEMLAHRGIDVSYETIRASTVKFVRMIAANLRRRKLPPSPLWHLDEMVSAIASEHVWIWRAVDDEGEAVR